MICRTSGSARRWQRPGYRPAVLLCLMLAGCRQQMADQPSYRPLEWTAFFADEQSARHPPAGTVARGHLRNDPHLHGGKTAAVAPGAYTDHMAGADGKSTPRCRRWSRSDAFRTRRNSRSPSRWILSRTDRSVTRFTVPSATDRWATGTVPSCSVVLPNPPPTTATGCGLPRSVTSMM